jgi:hypothetical protein
MIIINLMTPDTERNIRLIGLLIMTHILIIKVVPEEEGEGMIISQEAEEGLRIKEGKMGLWVVVALSSSIVRKITMKTLLTQKINLLITKSLKK